MTTPFGLRNNNPGNLRISDPPWQGVVGQERGFCVFDTPENGIRALAKNLLAYQTRHGLDTVRKMILRWAPPNENDTTSYVHSVAWFMGVEPDEKIDLHDETLLGLMVEAIIHHENGIDHPYEQATLEAGVGAALV